MSYYTLRFTTFYFENHSLFEGLTPSEAAHSFLTLPASSFVFERHVPSFHFPIRSISHLNRRGLHEQ